MKRLIIAVFLVITCMMSAQQKHIHFPENVNNPLTANELNKFEEVYGDGIIYLRERPSLLKNLKDLVRNRVKVIELPSEKIQGSGVYANAPDLSTVELYTVFNKNLSRDISYSSHSFNILKYAINFFPQEKKIYRMGNHFIVILPQSKIN